MISFFRKVRKKLIDSGSITRYLLYATGEILLVVIGILIALQVNTLNENQKQENGSLETIGYLEVELKEAVESLERITAFNNRILEGAELYLDGEISPDTLNINPGQVFSWTNYIPPSLDLPIVQQESGSDRKILGRPDLNAALRAVKSSLQTLEQSLFYLDEFWNSEVANYFIRTQTMVAFERFVDERDVQVSDIQLLYDDVEYKNLVALSKILTTEVVESSNELSDAMGKALILIDDLK